MTTSQEILKYSDPRVVLHKALKHGLDPTHITLSPRKTHKYVYFPPQGKPVHFGAMGYEDYTRHKDQKRLEAFRRRNYKWASAPKGSAAWLSYHLLW